MSPTQNSGDIDSEEPATTLPVEVTHFPDPHDSAHEATPTGIHDYELFYYVIHQSQGFACLRH